MGDEELAAPGELERVRRFVNTRDLELGTEALGSPADLAAWLGVPAAGDADLARALELREALRELLLANATGGEPPATALVALSAASGRAPLRVQPGAGGLELVAAGEGVDAALSHLLAIVVLAQADGTWPRLKACPGDRCHWALYDRTRSRTRRWCSGVKCGARTRSRDYRRRRSG
jgi:predicted RNA-binding Zn ribbon-like protein